jgi:hypothetical protein
MFVVDEIHVEEEDIDELESDSENDGEDTPAPYPIRASVIITKVIISLFCYHIAPININPDVRDIIVYFPRSA